MFCQCTGDRKNKFCLQHLSQTSHQITDELELRSQQPFPWLAWLERFAGFQITPKDLSYRSWKWTSSSVVELIYMRLVCISRNLRLLWYVLRLYAVLSKEIYTPIAALSHISSLNRNWAGVEGFVYLNSFLWLPITPRTPPLFNLTHVMYQSYCIRSSSLDHKTTRRKVLFLKEITKYQDTLMEACLPGWL